MYRVTANGKTKSFFTYTSATEFAKQLRQSGVKPEITGGLFSSKPDPTTIESVGNAVTIGYARVTKFVKAIPNLRIIVK